jgi:hypothetical protein
MIDSSAILAIVFQEPGAERIAAAIAASPVRHMSTVNWLETLIVLEGRHGAESATMRCSSCGTLRWSPRLSITHRWWKPGPLGGASAKDAIRRR